MIRGLWTQDMIGWILAAALLPPAGVLIAEGGAAALVSLALALLVAVAWQALFRQMQGVPFSPSGAVTAVLVVALGSPDAALWQIALAVSFGMILSDLVFGGWGRNVVPAPIAALAFLSLSFPSLAPAAPGWTMLAAAACSGAVLVATGIAGLRTLAAFALAGLAVSAAIGVTPALGGAVLLGLVFLVADPVGSAATPLGRWLHGALAGLLWALLAAGTDAPHAIVFAALLAAIFAPLLDHAALLAHLPRKDTSRG